MPFTQHTEPFIENSGMNYVTLRQVINDYIITMDEDDFATHMSDAAIRNLALRGIREFGFDVSARVKSIKINIESNNTAILPDDYVDIVKLGAVDDEGFLRVFRQNKNLNYSRKILQESGVDTTSTSISQDGPLNITSNETLNREDDKTSTTNSSDPDSGDLEFYIFENYLHQGGLGRLYGAGGSYAPGQYRINLDQNRIEIDTDGDATDVVLEYIADEARSTNPVIHVYAEEALRCYIYYKSCERKSTVPAGEKKRARAEYYNERRKAKARLSNFSKQNALNTLRKNFMQAPKY